jgi:cytochrome P450
MCAILKVESGRSGGYVLLRCIRCHLLTYTSGAPHLLEKDDVYNGYFIPAGTIVLPNQWYVYNHLLLCVLIKWTVLICNRAMLHDEMEYPEPSLFLPERWILKKGQKEPRHPSKVTFGFGRRCVLT